MILQAISGKFHGLSAWKKCRWECLGCIVESLEPACVMFDDTGVHYCGGMHMGTAPSSVCLGLGVGYDVLGIAVADGAEFIRCVT